jgi:hypothetical protein
MMTSVRAGHSPLRTCEWARGWGRRAEEKPKGRPCRLNKRKELSVKWMRTHRQKGLAPATSCTSRSRLSHTRLFAHTFSSPPFTRQVTQQALGASGRGWWRPLQRGPVQRSALHRPDAMCFVTIGSFLRCPELSHCSTNPHTRTRLLMFCGRTPRNCFHTVVTD